MRNISLRGRGLSIKLIFSGALVALCMLPVVAFGAQNLTVEFINVGAGDCIYIETPNGTDILIDGGVVAQGKKVVAYLQKLEPSMTLEYVINTHPDADHAGGLQEVFRQMEVARFYYPKDAPYSTVTAKRLLSLAKAEPNCVVYNARPGIVIKSAGARLEFVHSKTNYSTTNKDSVMTFLYHGNLQMLFTGDAERGAEAAGKRYNVDILQVPHHGSKYASAASFIKRYDPERIIISTDGKSYGHPHQETLKRYKTYSSSILCYRTDKLGNIKVTSNGARWWFGKADVGKKVGAFISASSGGTTGGGSTTSKTVYITRTGTKYHFNKKCRGLSNSTSTTPTTLADAKRKGFTLCGWED